MNRWVGTLTILGLIMGLVACAPAPEDGQSAAALQAADLTSELTTFEQKASYSLGMDIGNSVKRNPASLETEYVIAGLRDAMDEKPPKIEEKEAAELRAELRRRAQEESERQRSEQGARNLGESEAFLAKNAARPEVKTTESGLQYEVLQDAEGARPGPENRVTVHYRGTLMDGTEFDSSYSRNQPATFALNRVVPGWTEGLQLMPVGSKYKLYLPPSLGYGERGAGGKIGPNAALVFEVELLEIVTE